MYRAVYSSVFRKGFVFRVPDSHPKYKKIFLNKHCGKSITGLYSYNLFTDPDKAEDYIRLCLEYDDKRSKRLYDIGSGYQGLSSPENDKLAYRFMSKGKVD